MVCWMKPGKRQRKGKVDVKSLMTSEEAQLLLNILELDAAKNMPHVEQFKFALREALKTGDTT